MRVVLLVVCLLGGTSFVAYAQGTQADYNRAAKLSERTRNKVWHSKVEPHWFGRANNRFWFRRDLSARAHEFVVIDAEQGSRQPAFEYEQLAAALSQRSAKKIDANRLDLERLEFADDGTSIRFNTDGKGWQYSIMSNSLSEAELLKTEDARPPERNRRGGVSLWKTAPDGFLRAAFVECRTEVSAVIT